MVTNYEISNQENYSQKNSGEEEALVGRGLEFLQSLRYQEFFNLNLIRLED